MSRQFALNKLFQTDEFFRVTSIPKGAEIALQQLRC